MDLQTIVRRTRLPPRRLRYVLDHEMIPGLKIILAENAGGQPRTFSEYDGYRIACAGALLEAGMKREPAAQFVAALAKLAWTGGRFLELVFASKKKAFARLGDGQAFQVHFGSGSIGWTRIDGLADLAGGFKPRATVELDLASLRDDLRG